MNWMSIARRLQACLKKGVDLDGRPIDVETREKLGKILLSVQNSVSNATEADINDLEKIIQKFTESLHHKNAQVPTGTATPEIADFLFFQNIRLAAADTLPLSETMLVKKRGASGGRKGAETKRSLAQSRWIDSAKQLAFAIDKKGGTHASSAKAMASQIIRTWPNVNPPSERQLERLLSGLRKNGEILRAK